MRLPLLLLPHKYSLRTARFRFFSLSSRNTSPRTTMAELFSDLKERPLKDTVRLFDVDGTLSPARLHASPEMLQTLAALRHKCAIGFVCNTVHIVATY